MTDKQQKVLEMTKDICRHQNVCNDVCKPISACDALRYAERAVEAGYVKQSEGHWIVTDADSGSFGEYEPFIEFKCSKCESTFGIESGQYDWQYGDPIPWVACPLCGAKMKGGERE